jgi:DNA binding domain, excisionase family
MDKEILNMEEAAELFNVSVKTFIKLLKEEKVPARKIGREWRFSKSALVDWLSSGDSQAYSSSDVETKEFFNQVAPEWGNIKKGYYDESVKNILLDMKLLNKNMTVMDLGAGDGYMSLAVAGYVKKVIALDLSVEMLKLMQKRASDEGIENIEALEGDGCDIPLGDSSVDVVCSNMYLHHIDDPIIAIREMKRVLKPGGTVFLADFKEHNNLELKEKMHDVWLGFSMEEVKDWFYKSGFRKISFVSMPDMFIMSAVG